MVTYEIVVHDSYTGSFSINIRDFPTACRLYNSISLEDSVIEAKEFYSYDWHSRIRNRIDFSAL